MTRPHDGATERLAFDVDAIRKYFPALSDRAAPPHAPPPAMMGG